MIDLREIPCLDWMDQNYQVHDDNIPLFQMGFRVMCLVRKEVYMSLILDTLPTRGQLRQLRKLFTAFFADMTVTCYVANPTSVRFVEFFGFHFVAEQLDYQIYQRKV